MFGAGEIDYWGFDDVLSEEAVAVAITLTPGSSPGQALTLSHQGRGDIEVLPECVRLRWARPMHPLLSLRSRVPFAEAKGREVVARRLGDDWAAPTPGASPARIAALARAPLRFVKGAYARERLHDFMSAP